MKITEEQLITFIEGMLKYSEAFLNPEGTNAHTHPLVYFHQGYHSAAELILKTIQEGLNSVHNPEP